MIVLSIARTALLNNDMPAFSGNTKSVGSRSPFFTVFVVG